MNVMGTQMASNFSHLKHMAEVRPGLDGQAAKWAVAELDRQRQALEEIVQRFDPKARDWQLIPTELIKQAANVIRE